MKQIEVIKASMMDALERTDKNGVLQGEYVCHDEFLDETPYGLDTHFLVCGEIGEPSYLVLIQKIDP